MNNQQQAQSQQVKSLRVFNPQKYINQYYSDPQGHQEENMGIPFFKFMTKAFTILPQCSQGIQLGCGGVLTLAGFSSRKVKSLLLTDYNVECFPLISSYIQGQSLSRWKPHFQLISKLEGSNENVEERVRRAIEGCAKIDLTTPTVFEHPYFKKVDIIMSSLCIEVVSTSESHYSQIIGKLKKYLRPKGYMYLIGVLGQTFYMVEEQRLPCFQVTQDLLRSTMAANGFEIILLQVQMSSKPPTKTSDFKGLFSILAQLKE